MQHPPKRRLRLTSPHTRGEDVRRLQIALNARRRARHLATIEVDGEYGPTTAAAVRDTALALGVLESTLRNGCTVGIQRIVRNPKLRTPAQLARAAARRRAAKKALKQGPDAALAWARTKLGIKEQPPGSNTGPQIRDWQKAAGMGPGPWCGAFAKACADAGGADITPEARYTPWLIGHAKAGTGGYEGWCDISNDLAKPGDHVLFNFDGRPGPEHVGVLVRVEKGSGKVVTIDGNSAEPGKGSQADGGMVVEVARSVSLVIGVALVRWPR